MAKKKKTSTTEPKEAYETPVALFEEIVPDVVEVETKKVKTK